MNVDLSLSECLIAIPGLVGVYLTIKQNRKINPVHKQLTVNHHSSAEPTVKDQLDDIKKAQAFTLDILNEHIKEHNK